MFNKYVTRFYIDKFTENKDEYNELSAKCIIKYSVDKELAYSNTYTLYSRDRLFKLKKKSDNYTYDWVLELKKGLHNKKILKLLQNKIKKEVL